VIDTKVAPIPPHSDRLIISLSEELTMVSSGDIAPDNHTLAPPSSADAAWNRFDYVRTLSTALVAGLSDADATVQ
jgi:hypothetical protein